MFLKISDVTDFIYFVSELKVVSEGECPGGGGVRLS